MLEKVWREENLHSLVQPLGNQYGWSLNRVKRKLPCDPCDSISGYACVKNKNSDSKRYMSNVHWSFTYNKPEWKQCDCLLTDDWLKTMWCMYDFNNHVRVWELDHKEGWVPKNWCVLTVVLEKTIDSSLDTKETKPVNPKGNQPWIFIGRIDAEDPILWPSDAKSELIGKDLDARKDCG